MFASMMPGSRDIVVDIPPVERADHAKPPNWQFGSLPVGGTGAGCALVDEPLYQSVNGNTLPASLLRKASFGLLRDIETHGTLLSTGYRVEAWMRPSLPNLSSLG